MLQLGGWCHQALQVARAGPLERLRWKVPEGFQPAGGCEGSMFRGPTPSEAQTSMSAIQAQRVLFSKRKAWPRPENSMSKRSYNCQIVTGQLWAGGYAKQDVALEDTCMGQAPGLETADNGTPDQLHALASMPEMCGRCSLGLAQHIASSVTGSCRACQCSTGTMSGGQWRTQMDDNCKQLQRCC